MSRDEFLARVRDAVKAGRAHRVQLEQLPDEVGYVGGGPDLCATFAGEVEAVGGLPEILQSPQQVRESVERLIDEEDVARALCWQHPLLDKVDLVALLERKQVRRDDYDSLAALPREDRRQRMLEAELGISSVDYAVAETGSLVVCSRPGHERVISLLPPVHVAIVSEAQIVPDLFDVFARLQAAGLDKLPSNLAFISGPSKTGDIEMQLTTGVHGPGKWHVLILRSS